MKLSKQEKEIWELVKSRKQEFHTVELARQFGKPSNWASQKLQNLVNKNFLLKPGPGKWKVIQKQRKGNFLHIQGKAISKEQVLEVSFRCSDLDFYKSGLDMDEFINHEIFGLRCRSDERQQAFYEKWLLNKNYSEITIQKARVRYQILFLKFLKIGFPVSFDSWLKPDGKIYFNESVEVDQIFLEHDLHKIARAFPFLGLQVNFEPMTGESITYFMDKGLVSSPRDLVYVPDERPKESKTTLTQRDISVYLKKFCKK